MREMEILEAFGKPFPASDISWRLQYVDKEKLEGFAVPYLDARAIADRLDEVVGPFRWKPSYTPWHDYVTNQGRRPSQLCTIYIYDEERNEWIGKADGAEDSDIEPIKGGLSDAFKRAAVRWNIGRYLYKFQTVWVKAKKQGSSFVVDSSEKDNLKRIYNETVARIFGTAPAPTSQSMQKPAAQRPEPPAIAQTAPIYEIKRIKVSENENGARSSVIIETGGKQYQAFIPAKDERLKTGAKITNVKAEKKTNSYGTYNLIQSYDMAA